MLFRRLIGLALLVALGGCGIAENAATTPPTSASAAQAQPAQPTSAPTSASAAQATATPAAPPATQAPAPSPAAYPTAPPQPTAPPTAVPTAVPPLELTPQPVATIAHTPDAVELTFTQAAAGPELVQALADRQQDRLLVRDPSMERKLWLTDERGTILADVIADLARLERCNHPGGSLAPLGAWSPDGRYLAVLCEVLGPSERWSTSVLDTDSGTWHFPQPATASSIIYASWSPSAERLLLTLSAGFASTDAATLASWDVAAATAQPLVTITNANTDASIVWSHSGAQIALNGTLAGRTGLFVVDASDGSVTQIANEHHEPVGWSLDDQTVYTRRVFGPGRVQAVAVQSGSVSSIDSSDISAYAYTAALVPAPDQQQVLLTSTKLHLYAADATLLQSIPAEAGSEFKAAVWERDGGALIVALLRPSVGVTLWRYLLSADGRTLEQPQQIGDYPGNNILGLDLSPQGNLLLDLTGGYKVIRDSSGQELGYAPGTNGSWRP